MGWGITMITIIMSGVIYSSVYWQAGLSKSAPFASIPAAHFFLECHWREVLLFLFFVVVVVFLSGGWG